MWTGNNPKCAKAVSWSLGLRNSAVILIHGVTHCSAIQRISLLNLCSLMADMSQRYRRTEELAVRNIVHQLARIGVYQEWRVSSSALPARTQRGGSRRSSHFSFGRSRVLKQPWYQQNKKDKEGRIRIKHCPGEEYTVQVACLKYYVYTSRMSVVSLKRERCSIYKSEPSQVPLWWALHSCELTAFDANSCFCLFWCFVCTLAKAGTWIPVLQRTWAVFSSFLPAVAVQWRAKAGWERLPSWLPCFFSLKISARDNQCVKKVYSRTLAVQSQYILKAVSGCRVYLMTSVFKNTSAHSLHLSGSFVNELLTFPCLKLSSTEYRSGALLTNFLAELRT